MSTLLLDTHALVWWWRENPRLPPAARAAIAEPANRIMVSAASIWELATQYRLGKFPEAGRILDNLPALMQRSRFQELAVGFAHARLAGSMAGAHRDPFDRMLIAQSRLEDAPVVTGDAVFSQFGTAVVWV